MRSFELADHKEKGLPITVIDIEPVTGAFILMPDTEPPM
jgi:hypothetical protein